MILNFKKLSLMLFLASLMNLYCQDSKSFKRIFTDAEYYSIVENYSSALKYYEDLLEMDPDNSNLYYLSGYNCLQIMGNLSKAINYLELAVLDIEPSYKEGSYKERHAPLEAYFLLARAYHKNNEFDKAIELYMKYKDLSLDKKFADIEFINAQIKSCELGMSMIKKPINVSFHSSGNLIYLNDISLNPVVSGNDSIIIYNLDKPSKKLIMMSVKQENGWSEPRHLNNELEIIGNFSPVSLSYDGTDLYLVKNEYFETDIYVSHFRNQKWSGVIKLNNNINTRYQESHACISRDNKSLYFTSDRPGGQGALDIYVSERKSGEDWGTAHNLGATINSYYNEESPFIIKNDTKLYFSSQGHATMGGYDIYISEKTNDGSWTIPENIGYPLSTSDDDLFYNPGWNGGLGYYSFINDAISLNRNIYLVKILPPEDIIIGIRNLGDPKREAADVQVKSSTSHAALGIYYILNNILFDFEDHALDESDILEVERVYMLMKRVPEISIEFIGHPDAKDSADQNPQLAIKRAESVAGYLTNKGISADRMLIRSAGEKDKIAPNKYEDGTDAPNGRIFNRYISIKINNLNNEEIHITDIFLPENITPIQDQTFFVLLSVNKDIIDTIPLDLIKEPVSRIATDASNLYVGGNFEREADAIKYLNEVIDEGYLQARIIEQQMLEYLIRENSEGDPFKTLSFSIQVSAIRNPLNISNFRDMEKVRKYVDQDGIDRYVFGEYDSIEKALDNLPLAHQQGYKDAYILVGDRYE